MTSQMGKVWVVDCRKEVVCFGGIGGDNTVLGIGLSDSVLNRNQIGSLEGDLLLERCLTA